MSKNEDYYNESKGCEHRFIGVLISFMVVCIIAFMAILMSGCEKEPEYCWRCHMYFYEKIYIDGNVFEKRYQDSTDLCGYTERDIKKYEVYRTMRPYSINTCGNHIRWQDCLCVKK